MVKSSHNLVARHIPNYDNDKLVSCMLLQVCLLYLETGTVLSCFIWQLKIISRSIKVKTFHYIHSTPTSSTRKCTAEIN